MLHSVWQRMSVRATSLHPLLDFAHQWSKTANVKVTGHRCPTVKILTECYVSWRRVLVHCKRYSGWREQWENSFAFFFCLFLVKLHSWRRAVNDNRRGCAPSGKTLAGETERRTYGRVQWTDRETWTRLIISSCVINLDLNTIGREAQWTRHPTDRSICLHWWICSHTYMCTHAAAHKRAHTHTHPYKWAGWVSLRFAKLPNPPPR